jgi:hypothetical protein
MSSEISGIRKEIGAVARMTPKERFLTTVQGNKPDKIPTFVGSHGSVLYHYYGLSPRDQASETAQAIARFVREFEYGSVSPYGGYINLGCGPELGVKWDMAGDNMPGAIEGVIKSREDLDQLRIPDAPSGYFQIYLDTLGILKDTVDDVNISGMCLGPFSVACFLRGMENVLLDSKLDLPFYHAYMERCVEFSMYFGDHVNEIGLPFSLNEIYLIPEVLSAQFFHDHIAPYDGKVGAHFREKGVFLPNPMAPFMGKNGDPVSQKEGRTCYYSMFGTKESLEIIKIASKYSIPGLGKIFGLSGRMLIGWKKESVIEFLKQAVDFFVHEQGVYPAIYTAGLEPPTRESTFELVDKLRGIQAFLDSYPL